VTRKTGAIYEDQYKFLIISHSFLLKMKKKVSEICIRKTKSHILNLMNFSKILPFVYYGGKCCTAVWATNDNMAHAHCMLGTYGYKHTYRVCNNYCFSTVTKNARKRLDVTLQIHCLSCWYYWHTFHARL